MPANINSLLALVHSTDRNKIRSDIEAAMLNGGTLQHEFRINLPSGEKIIQAIGYLDSDQESSPNFEDHRTGCHYYSLCTIGLTE
jgi:hypothetical protein